MKSMQSLRFISLCVFLVVYGVAAPALAASQNQSVSLGEAARHLRAQQKPVRPGAKVWTNDDVPTLPTFGVNVVGELPPSVAEAGKETKPAAGAKEDQKGVEASLADEKTHLDAVSKELDLLQRELTLDEQQFYSNPGNATDVQGKAKLDAQKDQIAAKQQEVQQSKDKIADLEAKLAKLKAAPPAAPATPQPQP